MKVKAIFLGMHKTLCDHQGVVPHSALQACEKARQNGHRIFLSKGYSKAEIQEEALSVGLDGVVGEAGDYLEVADAIQEFGINIEDTIAIGDSVYDLEMLETAQLGVAMGNASETVKAYADDITHSVDEDGLYKAFKKYGLI